MLTACNTLPDYPPAPEGFYRVQSGDTVSGIAVANGRSTAEITRWNTLTNPNAIEVGQLLRITPPPGAPKIAQSAPKASASSSTTSSQPAPQPVFAHPDLVWPAQGKVITLFNGSLQKGIDIAAAEGSEVKAAAAGRVTYAGTGTRGYGNLLIIKHSNDFITVYAHNKVLIAKEGETVRQGQRIALVGNSDADRVKLHFELRRLGEPLDPLRYLPQAD